MKRFTTLIAVVIILFSSDPSHSNALSQPAACVEAGTTKGDISVLLVGNSLMNGIPSRLKSLLTCRGYEVDIAISNPGGYWLYRHNKNARTLGLIARGYDWVLLQEQSGGITGHRRPYETIISLKEKIEAAGGKMGLYQTWAFSSRDPKATAQIINRYETIGKDLKAPVYAIGRAWDLFYNKYPRPPFSLFADKVHASSHGQCLISYVLYSYLTKSSPTGLPSLGLSDRDAGILQQIAWKTFRTYPE